MNRRRVEIATSQEATAAHSGQTIETFNVTANNNWKLVFVLQTNATIMLRVTTQCLNCFVWLWLWLAAK